MNRSPHMRPTVAAMLSQLRQFTKGQGASHDGHSYLPETAMVLIDKYQRNPQLIPSDESGEETANDSTAVSLTEPPAFV